MANLKPNGDFNSDTFLRAMLQLRNTPDPDCGLSPAEIVFGHPLRDAFSFVNRLQKFSNRHICRSWRETWKAKESAHRLRAKQTDLALRTHSRPYAPLKRGDRVFVQNQRGHAPRKWDKIGSVVEVLNFDQYNIKIDGSGRITKRNRRFLRPVNDSSTESTFHPRQPTIAIPEETHPVADPSASSPASPLSDEQLTDVSNDSSIVISDESTCEPPPQQRPSCPIDNQPPTHASPRPPRRSTRMRSSALELDPESGRWIARGSYS